MFITALFTIARTWKQPRCPSADKWIRKLWYIHTMEYYSAIKKNAFESVLMRWIKRTYYTEWSKSERKTAIQYINAYIWNLERWQWWPICETAKETEIRNRVLDSVGEGKDGMFWENSVETSILSRVKQIASPGWMHETSARGWCIGKTQRNGMEREAGAGIGMGNTCKSMANSCQCMEKPLQYCKVISLQLIKINGKKMSYHTPKRRNKKRHITKWKQPILKRPCTA